MSKHANPTSPDPKAKETATQGPENKEPTSMPQSTIDPIDASAHLWSLRLWFVCALIIVAFAVCNYLLNWFAR